MLEWVAVPFSKGIFPTQGSNPGLPHTSVGLDKEVTPCVHHCGIIQSIFTALETHVDLS